MTLNPDPSLPSAKQQGDLVNHTEFNALIDAVKEHREELTERLSEDTLKATYVAVLRPEQFGAAGDGTTDDSAAIQAMFDAVTSTGRTLIDLGDGKSYLVAGVTLSADNVTMRGRSKFVMIPQDWSNWNARWCVKVAGTEESPLTGIVLEDFEVDGTKSEHSNLDSVTSWGEGLDLEYLNDFTVQRVTVHDCAADGIDLDYCYDGTVMLCHLYDNDGFGIHTSTGSSRNRIIGNVAHDNGDRLLRGGIDQFTGSAVDPENSPAARDNVYSLNVAYDNYRNYRIGADATTTPNEGTAAFILNHSLGTVSEDDVLTGLAPTVVPSTLTIKTGRSANGNNANHAVIRAERDLAAGTSQVALAVRTIIDGTEASRMEFCGDALRLRQSLVLEGASDATVRHINMGATNGAGNITGRRDVDGGSNSYALTIQTSIDESVGVRAAFSGRAIELFQPVRLSSYTNTGRGGLTPVNGMVIYNQQTHELQAYINGEWKALATTDHTHA